MVLTHPISWAFFSVTAFYGPLAIFSRVNSVLQYYYFFCAVFIISTIHRRSAQPIYRPNIQNVTPV